MLRDPALRLVPEHQIAPDAFLHATTGGHDVLEKNRLFNNFKLARFVSGAISASLERTANFKVENSDLILIRPTAWDNVIKLFCS